MAERFAPTIISAGEIDFPRIIWYEIFEIVKLMHEGNQKTVSKALDTFETLLRAYWDLEYTKNVRKIKIDGIRKLEGLENPENKNKRTGLHETMNRKIFGEQLALISRSGFLPYKEVEGVISEFKEEDVVEPDETVV